MRLDVFCKVIDNFGDIGVCWRLARQLQKEYALQVRLWVDDLSAFQQLIPTLALDVDQQVCANITVCHWHAHTLFDDCADAVVEAFACEIPPDYIALMAAKAQPPVWLNLEYLSAEDWVEGCHLLPSIHPSTGLKKQFFFPGFTTKTGGLLLEADLLAQRDTYQAQQQPQAAWQISLFCYPNLGLTSLLRAWQNSPRPVDCYVASGKPLAAVQAALGVSLAEGASIRIGALHLHALPFLSQQAYDELLWRCDFNFVRGEDSFVRAQWAAKPFIWHIYPQEDGAHQAKLGAFLTHYLSGVPLPAQAALRAMFKLWNATNVQPLAIQEAWQACCAQYGFLLRHARVWCEYVAKQNNLAACLVKCLK